MVDDPSGQNGARRKGAGPAEAPAPALSGRPSPLSSALRQQIGLTERVARLAWLDCADGATRRELAAAAAHDCVRLRRKEP